VEVQKRKLALAAGWTQERLAEAADVFVAKSQHSSTTPERSTRPQDDPLTQMIVSGMIVEPPFDLLTLSMLPEHSSELNQCIEAMEVGVAGFGWRLEPRINLDKADEATVRAANKERTRLINFFEYASIEDDYNTVRTKMVCDNEAIGAMYLEVIRDIKGGIQGWEHVPAAQVRLGRQTDEMIEIETPILELQEDGSVKVVKIKRYKRFRLFLQQRHIRRSNLSTVTSRRHTWYKELGDPRYIDNKTGKEIKEPEEIERARKENRLANELIFLRQYTSRSPYGLPRYIGNLLSIFGDRAAEEINFITFKNNNIPSLAVLVSNGQLTEGTVKRIESFVEAQIQGSDNYSKMLIIEAESFMEGEDGGHMKLDIKPLTREQHKDAMFQKYSSNNRDSTRRAFRLPPILVGRSEDYTRATAETSRRLADEQVFSPERYRWDKFINRRIFPAMGIRFWEFKSNSPNTTDNQELVKLLGTAEKTGGMTPRIARQALSDVLGKTLPDFPDDFDPDIPFSLLMAEAVKNKAEPTEPGQQLTAIKMLTGALDEVTPEDIAQAGEDAVVSILKVRKALEHEWMQQLEDLDLEDDVGSD
jgi:PBSX family phage portal protein